MEAPASTTLDLVDPEAVYSATELRLESLVDTSESTNQACCCSSVLILLYEMIKVPL